MSYVKITAVVASKCSRNSVGFQTDPFISEEVMKEAQNKVDSHSSLKLSLDGTTVIVSGTVFPPSQNLAASTSEILTSAHNAVEERHQLEAVNHKNLVDQYAKAYSLPVTE